MAPGDKHSKSYLQSREMSFNAHKRRHHRFLALLWGQRPAILSGMGPCNAQMHGRIVIYVQF